MPAINIPASQIAVEPVTNFFKGRAMRQESELRQKEIDTYDDKFDLQKRQVAAQEMNAETNAEIAKQRRVEFEDKVGRENAKIFATEGYAAVWSAKQRMKTDVDAGLSLAYENLGKYADTLPEEDAAPIRAALEDKQITEDELNQIEAGFVGALGEYGLLEKDEVTLKDHVNYEMPNGDLIMARPNSEKANLIEDAGGIRAGNKTPGSGDKPTYDPPNSNEIAAAEELVKNDPLLNDLEDSAETKIAVMMLANDIRQLQEDLGLDYAQAAQTALKQLKRRVTTEKDFLSGTDSKLNLDSEGLAGNEYLGNDGNIYVEESDGSFRRKN